MKKNTRLKKRRRRATLSSSRTQSSRLRKINPMKTPLRVMLENELRNIENQIRALEVERKKALDYLGKPTPTRTGRYVSPETRAKISASQKARYEKLKGKKKS